MKDDGALIGGLLNGGLIFVFPYIKGCVGGAVPSLIMQSRSTVPLGFLFIGACKSSSES